MEFNVIGIDDVTTSPTERFTCATNDGTNIYVGSDSVSGTGHVWKYSPATQQWSRITDNLNTAGVKSISSIKYKNSKLYAGTQGTYLATETGQIWVNAGTVDGWTQLTIPNAVGLNVNTALRTILFNNNDLYTAGSYLGIWKYSGGSWSIAIDPGYAYGLLATWNDLATDGSNIYGAVTTNNSASANVLKFDGASWSQITTNAFGDKFNIGTSKVCWHNNKLYAATHNDKTGSEIWEYNGGSWSQINTNGFGFSGNYNTVSLESIDNYLVASVEGVSGGSIWKYSGSWTQEQINTDVIYTSYIIQRLGNVNYLVGTVRKNLIVTTNRAPWVTTTQRSDASANYFPDGSLVCFPVENNKYRFIGANSMWTLVTEGTLDNPLENVISPTQYSKYLQIYGVTSKNGITKGTDIQEKKIDFSGFNPVDVTANVYLPNVRYMSGGLAYKIPDTSTLIIWAHGEEGYWEPVSVSAQFAGAYFNSFVRQLVSFDNGTTIYDCGTVLHSTFKGRPNSTVTPEVDVPFNAMGLGGYVVKDGYFYFYYNNDSYAATLPYTSNSRLSIMRASYSDVIESALNKTTCNWYKYFNNSFGQSSLTGSAQDILPYVQAPGWLYASYSPTLQKTIAFNTTNQNTRDYNLIYDIPFEVSNEEFDDECYAIFSDDGFNWSFPEKICAFIGASSVYALPLSTESYKGELSDQFKVISMPANWSSPNNISYYHNAIVQPIRDIERSFSISRYSQPYKIPQAIDRGQLHPFVATIHHIGESAKLLEASAHYYYNPSEYIQDNKWKNVLQSYANSSTELSGDFPNSFDDYINFRLGREFHKFYDAYNHEFSSHRTSPIVTKQDGPVILAHALGSLLYNSDLSKRGSLATAYPNLITTKLSNTVEFRNGEGVFSSGGTASGTYTTSSILNVGRRQSEYRNSGILDHVELCQVSGTSRNNNFVVLDIDPSFKSSTRRNSLLDDNILIKQSAFDGFGRIIFDISKYTLDSNLYDVTRNFLSPNHEFKFKFRSVISNSEGLSFGGGTVGVWIHTKPEMNKVWSFTKDGVWVQHSASSITIPEVLLKSHLVNLPRKDRESKQFKCIKFLDRNNPNKKNDVIASISEEDFTDISINFHTRNHACVGTEVTQVPQDYFENISNHVHRLNQNYVIEIFTLPTQDDKFTVYYDFSMMDLTLNKWSKPLITGIPNGSTMGDVYCQEFRVDLDKQQILNVIKYFNQIRGDYSKAGYTGANNLTGYASRVAATTSGIYEVSGGSRLNYTESPLWNTTSINASSLIETLTIIN
jgi:hypothetical protein